MREKPIIIIFIKNKKWIMEYVHRFTSKNEKANDWNINNMYCCFYRIRHKHFKHLTYSKTLVYDWYLPIRVD